MYIGRARCARWRRREKALSEALATEQLLGQDFAARTVEAARWECCEGYEVEGMKKRQEGRNAHRAEAEDDADIVWMELQERGVAYAEDIDTTAEDSVEHMVAWAAPSAGGSIDSLVVASCSVAWADRAYRVFDGHQASASAHKAGPRSDSSSLETSQRLPRCHDDISRRKAKDRYSSVYGLFRSPEDDSWSTLGGFDVLGLQIRLRSVSIAVEG